MTGKLDEISEAIGGLRATTEGLGDAFRGHCRDDDRRHVENLAVQRDTCSELAKLNATLAPIAEWVAKTKPMLEAMQVSRAKTAGALALLAMMLAGIGALLEATLGSVVHWLLTRGH